MTIVESERMNFVKAALVSRPGPRAFSVSSSTASEVSVAVTLDLRQLDLKFQIHWHNVWALRASGTDAALIALIFTCLLRSLGHLTSSRTSDTSNM